MSRHKKDSRIQAVRQGNSSVLSSQTEIRTASFYGPFPVASQLAEYAAIRPDMLDRVVGLTERQAAHRQELEQKNLHFQAQAVARSTFAGLLVALSGLVLTGYVAHLDHPMAATVIGSVDLVGLVSVFVLGRRPEKSAAPSAPK